MPQEFSHRVVAIVTEESNPFEMGVATELFGLRRPELDRPWYDFTLCAATPEGRMNLGKFTPAARRAIVNGTPLIHVDIYEDSIDVAVEAD